MQGARQSTARQLTVQIFFITQENGNGLCPTRNRLGRADYEKIALQSAKRCDALSAHPLYLSGDKLMDIN